MRYLKTLLRSPGFFWLLFGGGALLYNWPILGVAAGSEGCSLVLYLFGIWIALILVLGLTQALGDEESPPKYVDGGRDV